MAEGNVDLLERMRQSRSSWGEDDFHHLYRSFGLQEITRPRAPHRVYIHPEFPDLRATVGRHRSLARGYATRGKKRCQEPLLDAAGERLLFLR